MIGKKRKNSSTESETPKKNIKIENQQDKKIDINKKNEKKPKTKPKTPLKFMKKNDKKFSKTGKSDIKKNQSPNEKVDWKKMKLDKKKLKINRKIKKANDLYDSTIQAKKIDEILRRKNLEGGDEERKRLINELHQINKGNYQKLVNAHDTVRIIQHLIKYATIKIREEISKELEPIFSQIIQTKYGKFLIDCLLKYGTLEIRSKIIESFNGYVLKLCCNAQATHTFANAIEKHATLKQKLKLAQEFYGEIYRQHKEKEIKCIEDCYKNSTDMKTLILSTVKANLNRVIEKGYMDNCLIHLVLNDYLHQADCKIQDWLEQLLPHVVALANSKDGAKVVMKMIWGGSNKEKKAILKKFKEHIKDLCCHEFAYTTIIAILDSVDDTVMVNKIIVSEIVENVQHLMQNECGRKVLLWLFAPTDAHYFHPKFNEDLQIGFESSTSKKSREIRRQELFNFAFSKVLDNIVNNTNEWFSNSSVALAAVTIVKKCETKEQFLSCFDAISSLICQPKWCVKEKPTDVKNKFVDKKSDKNDDSNNDESIKLEPSEELIISGIEHSGLHVTLKKLIQHDKILVKEDLPLFGEAVLQKLTDETLEKWLKTNRGCFILLTLIESEPDLVVENLTKLIKNHKKILRKQDTPGGKILLKKINLEKF